jgi:hypothetical protein
MPGSCYSTIRHNKCWQLTFLQVLEQCVGLHSIIIQRLKQATELQNNHWGFLIVSSICIVKTGFDQSCLHKSIQSRKQMDSVQSLEQTLIPLDNLYQACYELLSETFTLLSQSLQRSKLHNFDSSGVLDDICEEIVPLCQNNQLR